MTALASLHHCCRQTMRQGSYSYSSRVIRNLILITNGDDVFFYLRKYLGYNTPPKKLRLPSSTRPPAASRCRHVQSAQQHYDVPAKGRLSVPHLGEGEAWNRSRGRLAWPPAWRGIVNSCKSRPAREHCNQRIGCCSPVRCIALRTAALLYCCTG